MFFIFVHFVPSISHRFVVKQVDLYTGSALELLLPAILDGTGHANWRIRQSSVELLGDLLFHVRLAFDMQASDAHRHSAALLACETCSR